MNKLKHAIRFLCDTYPHKHELSNARLTKMVYLADWKSAVLYGKQITNIEWYFDNFGPFVFDVVNTARDDDYMFVREDRTPYGTNKTLIGAQETDKADGKSYDLSENELAMLRAVIEDTKSMYWNDFISYVYSTFPVVNNNRYTTLDLVEQAALAGKQGNHTSHIR
ncbi:Panacea domain-containing protein [Granulosicoccus sp. 3-233]|uniref:Panacea domain-containing protein n=1 Tax=Granulosicoccus sp. 3-233 TaxID=3417969 RepID=UPI003D335C1B